MLFKNMINKKKILIIIKINYWKKNGKNYLRMNI